MSKAKSLRKARADLRRDGCKEQCSSWVVRDSEGVWVEDQGPCYAKWLYSEDMDRRELHVGVYDPWKTHRPALLRDHLISEGMEDAYTLSLIHI